VLERIGDLTRPGKGKDGLDGRAFLGQRKAKRVLEFHEEDI